MVTQARHEPVRQIIREAFAEVPYPGDSSIAYDPDDWEGRDINLDFSGYHWRELPHAIVSYHDSALSFLSAAGMQFYLPAYLLAALESDGDVLDSVLYALRPSEDQRKDYFESPEASFTTLQRRAVRAFLEWVRDEVAESDGGDAARQALDAYWGKDESKLERA